MPCPARLFDRAFLRFLLVGVSNTAVGYGCILVAMAVFGLDVAAANAAGYAVGIVWSFALNRRWTFRDAGGWGSFLRFLLVTAVAYGLNLLVVLVFADGLGAPPWLAQLAGIPPYTLCSFVGMRLFAFRAPSRAPS